MRAKRTMKTPYGSYLYYIGNSFVSIESPNGKRWTVDISTMTGRSWDQIEKGRWKHTQDGEITPGDVRRYLDGLHDEKTGRRP